MILGLLLAGVVLGLLCLWGLDWGLSNYFSIKDTYDEQHTVTTDDGVELNLWRYKPDSPNGSPPVFLVHGLTANHRNLAFDDRKGLAQFLNRKGYDCWAIDLRGRGQFRSSNGTWCFDDYLDHDVPSAIDHVLDETDSDAIHWIGHSMGGMLLLAHAGSAENTRPIASGVTIGSPVQLNEPTVFKRIASYFMNLPNWIYRFVRPFLMGGFLLQVYLIPWRLWFLILIERTYSREALRVISNVIVPRVNYRVPLQFLRWLGTGKWNSSDGRRNYRDNLSNVDVPMLTVIGGRDLLCPDRETAGFDRLGSPDKRLLKAARSEGFSRDYDHVSLVFAESARDELFTEIESWIASHS